MVKCVLFLLRDKNWNLGKKYRSSVFASILFPNNIIVDLKWIKISKLSLFWENIVFNTKIILGKHCLWHQESQAGSVFWENIVFHMNVAVAPVIII